MSVVDLLEFLAFFVIALGVGLALGTVDALLGVGVALVVFALFGLIWLVAYERGS